MTEVRQLRRRILRARMDHVCVLCGGVITMGQRYVRIVSVVDGCFGTSKYHAPALDGAEDQCDKPMCPVKPFWACDREEEE